MVKKLLFFILLFSFSSQSQNIERENLFSYKIEKNIHIYVEKSNKAYRDQDFKEAEALFEYFINQVVNNSYMDNFKVKKLSGRTIELYDFEKPIFLMTYASWCTPGVGEIPALNEIVQENYKNIDFVILFWDSKENVKKVARDYDSKINLLYVDETENKHNYVIETMKHSLGFPTSFFIDENKKIIDVRRGVLHPYNEEYAISYELNYNAFLNGISLLKNFSSIQEGLVTQKNP